MHKRVFCVMTATCPGPKDGYPNYLKCIRMPLSIYFMELILTKEGDEAATAAPA